MYVCGMGVGFVRATTAPPNQQVRPPRVQFAMLAMAGFPVYCTVPSARNSKSPTAPLVARTTRSANYEGTTYFPRMLTIVLASDSAV